MGKSRHLSEDEIRYIVSAETSKAQQEIHELTKATSTLKKEERERRKAMIELEAQGKKNTVEYQNLAKECKQYTQQISANNKRIEEMRKKLDINAMSMVQLKKQAKDLRTQLDNMSQALNPREYADLERQLQKVNERMSDLKGNAKSIAELAKGEGTISVMMGNLFTKMAEWAGNTLAKMKDIALEGVEMAASADGVTRAFRAMDDGTMLDKLRKATKDTVTDLDLMKAAVQAKDFRIPLEDLGKYLQFAQLKAQQTGQSVDYMTQSIVTGLGRKSVMILDNLGLSAAEINEEMSKTGDFMSAVAAIVDKQLVAAGDNYVSAADRAMQKSVEFKNAQRELGETLLPLKEKWDDVYGGMEVGTMKLIGWIVKHRASLVTLMTAVTAYIAVQKIATAWNAKHASSTMLSVAAEKLQAVQVALSRKAFLAKLIVMDLYKGRCNLATAATEMFNIVLKASPLGVVTGLLAAAAAAMYMFRGRTSLADKSIVELNKKLSIERASLNNVFEELKKTNPGTTERARLVKELSDKYPDLLGNYDLESAKLKEITKAQNEANTALTNRIATEMKSSEISKYVENNVSSQMELTDRLMKNLRRNMSKPIFDTLQNSMRSFLDDSSKSLEDFKDKYGQFVNMGISDQTLFTAGFKGLRSYQSSVSDGLDKINKKYEPYIKSIKTVTTLSDEELKKQMEANSIIKKLEAEKVKVQNTWKEDTKKNIALKNRELERLDEEIKKYRELGTVKASKDNSNKADKIKDKEDKSILATEKDVIKSLEQLRDEELQNLQKWYNTYTTAFNADLAENLISKEQHEMLMLELEKNYAENRLKVEQVYLSDAQSLELKNGELKVDQVKKANQRVLDAEKVANESRIAEQKKFNDLVNNFKSEFKVTTAKEEYEMEIAMLKATYQTQKEMSLKYNRDSIGLDIAYHEALLKIESEFQQKKRAVKEQYGLTTQKERYDAELEQLKEYNRQGLLSDEEYEEAKGRKKIEHWKKQFDYYSNLFSGAVQALQQAEMDNVDAQYDAEIEAAKGNTEEVERLEKEKAQKKLDIQKKYADVNFAIKVSQIIANTAVSIMQAFADLGPIAGAVAAALMGITGAAQIASANAERKKVKNMTLSGGSSSSKGSGMRVATGREEGGKIDVRRAQDGKIFKGADYDPDARGFIDKPTVIVGEGPAGQSKEWVASNAAVENPTVGPILDLIDKSQQAGTIRTLDLSQAIRSKMAGFSSGGSISQPLPASDSPKNNDGGGVTLPPQLMEKFANAIINMNENGVKAPIVLSDFEKKQALLEQSRQIGTKG